MWHPTVRYDHRRTALDPKGPYLLAGVVYNLAIAWPLFRRFSAKNT